MAERKYNSDELLAQGRKDFERCSSAEKDNRQTALDDIKFSRLSQQWPNDIVKQRELEKRPCLTVNKMKPFIRQVVNDARQNKPQIKVRPVDDTGDLETAKVINGMIRNIEYTSNADVAYDTAIEASVSGGFGYWRIGMDYAYEDVFDMDLTIERVLNQFAVYSDPDSKEADSSDWNTAFIVERLSMSAFQTRYAGKKNIDGEKITTDLKEMPQELRSGEKPVSFDSDSYSALNNTWVNDDSVMIAEWWTRREEEEEIVKLSNGHIYCADELEEPPEGGAPAAPAMPAISSPDAPVELPSPIGMVEPTATEEPQEEKYDDAGSDDEMAMILLGLAAGTLTIVARRTRKVHKVRQVIMTGADVLEVNEWPGKFIPIVPVYGDEIYVEGKRYFRSLIHDAKDAQRMFNYWKSTSTELVALAPRVPFIGRKGTFDSDSTRWATANTQSHAYLEFDTEMPQRLPLDSGTAAGAMNEALSASDDMKAIIGLYDASLGARSNETSGKAIMARQREGDVSTFHFIDNLSRAIRHTGRILIDLIPKVYTGERIVRIIGEDGSQKAVPVNTKEPVPQTDPNGKPEMDEQGQAIMALHDITSGKYDLTVETGPSFTTKREEAAAQMTEFIRSFPQAAPVIGDLLAKNLDWPGADEIAERLQRLVEQQNGGGVPPQMQQQMQQMGQELQKLQQENTSLKQGKQIDANNAETNRMNVIGSVPMPFDPFGLGPAEAAPQPMPQQMPQPGQIPG